MDRQGPGDKVISVVTYIVYAFFAFVCAYPFYYIIINSISANNLSERCGNGNCGSALWP